MSAKLMDRPGLAPQQEALPTMTTEVHGIVNYFYGAPCQSSGIFSTGAELTPQQMREIEGLSECGYEFAAGRYGTSYPVSRAGYEAHLGYNNGDHVRTFQETAVRLDEALGLSPRISAVNERIVPPWHDADQTSIVKGLPRTGEDESRSAQLLTFEMRRRQLPEDLAEVAAYGVLATRVVLGANGIVVGQWGSLEQEYPSKDAELAAVCAATNDLAGIYGPRGPLDGCFLYAQRYGVAPDEVPPLDGLAKHFAGQRIFLENHKFPVKIANELFTDLKGAVIEHTESLAKQVEAGTISDPAALWKRIIQQNIEFLEKHS